MKTALCIILLSAAGLFISASCNKNKEEDPHNHSLLNKSIDEIRAEIAGTWKVQYDSSNGIAGPMKNTPPIGTNEFISFLSYDTIKWIYNGSTYVFDKMLITKRFSHSYSREVYVSVFDSGAYFWTMDQIRNDTLVIEAGFLAGGGLRYYLTKYQ